MTAGPGRSAAIDWMRGIVMVLMTIDHASLHYNKGRAADDTAVTYVAGSVLPAAQFFTRWITHLCAPTFVFLAGTALALSVARRQQLGERESTITRDIVIRGAIIAGLDLTYMSLLAQTMLLQVLYAIGASMILLAFLRRLPTQALLAIGLLGIACSELVAVRFWDAQTAAPPLVLSLLLVPTFSRDLLIIYPALPWLWMMLLGWCFGRFLLHAWAAPASTSSPRQLLTLCGLAGLITFAVIRTANSYGNMLLYRADDSLVQWLHVSKYPPGIAYTALELGVMALILASLMQREARVGALDARHPLNVFGQTALFYYVAHQFLLGFSAQISGLAGKGGLLGTYVAALLCAIALYPLCRWYRALRARHPRSPLRYL